MLNNNSNVKKKRGKLIKKDKSIKEELTSQRERVGMELEARKSISKMKENNRPKYHHLMSN